MERIPAGTYSYQSTKIWNDFSVSWGTYFFSGTKREPYPLTIMSFRCESYRMNDLIIKSEWQNVLYEFYYLSKSMGNISIQTQTLLDISWRHHWFLREMTSEKRAQKFHTDDASLPRSGWCFWLVESNFPRGTTNQKHYPDLGSDASSVWNFCARSSDVISRRDQSWRREMSSVFSG